MISNLLKSFIVGSSIPISLPFLYRVSKIPDVDKNYSYETYSFVAPVFFGGMSVFATILNHTCNISLLYSLLIITIISVVFVLFLVDTLHSYNFTTRKQWLLYILRLIIFHSIAYTTIYYLINLLD